MEEHKAEIADWDLGAGIYISFYIIKKSLQEENAMSELVREFILNTQLNFTISHPNYLGGVHDSYSVIPLSWTTFNKSVIWSFLTTSTHILFCLTLVLLEPP